MKCVQDTFNFSINRLKSQYSHTEAYNLARWLIEAITKKSAMFLYTNQDHLITDEQMTILDQWLHMHLEEHKPIQYIIGWVPFCDLNIHVRPPILIPRPETEEWCARLIQTLKSAAVGDLHILDMCTGSGCIALVLARAFPQCMITAIDIDLDALSLLIENVQHNNITNVTAIQSDLYSNLKDRKFDIIVANPPYIGMKEWYTLPTSVRAWEDQKALIGGAAGNEIIDRIIMKAPHYLRHNHALKKQNIPNVIIEIGSAQAFVVSTTMKKNNYENVQIWRDLAQHERVVCGNFDI